MHPRQLISWALSASGINKLYFLYKIQAPLMVYRSYLKSRYRTREITSKYKKQTSDFERVKDRLQLSSDWFSHHVPNWLALFEHYSMYQKEHLQALEIGSWEGLSSYFLLHTLSNAQLTCVDTWQGADEHRSGAATTAANLANIETLFDQNLKPFRHRITKYKGTSSAFFATERIRERFDIVYVDGSHHSDDVMLDAISGFNALKVGGLLIFDDYFWRHYPKDIDNPAGAINAFVRLKKGAFKIAHLQHQMVIEKTG